MKLCDIQMLPGRIIDMENMADTLNAEDFLLEQLRGQIEDLERQGNILGMKRYWDCQATQRQLS